MLTAMTRHSSETVAPKRRCPNILSTQRSQRLMGECQNGGAQTVVPKWPAPILSYMILLFLPN